MNRKHAHAVVRTYCKQQAELYIREAEHMEGNGYWRNYFKTDQEIIDDVALYFTGKQTIT